MHQEFEVWFCIVMIGMETAAPPSALGGVW